METKNSSGWIFLVVFVVVLIGGGFLLLRELGREESLDDGSRPRAESSETPRRDADAASIDPDRDESPAPEAGNADTPPPIDGIAPMVRGRVLGQTGPVANAEVRLYSLDYIYETISRIEDMVRLESLENLEALIQRVKGELATFAAKAETTRSDKDGWFAFQTVEPGVYFALTLAKDHVFGFGDTVPAEVGVTREVVVELDRGSSIDGRVVDPRGESVEGVTVAAVFHPPGMAGFTKIVREMMGYLNGEFLRGPLVTKTGPSGDFRFDTLPRGNYDLIATREGSAPVMVEAKQTGSQGVLIILTPGAEITGTLTDTEGNRLAGLPVRLEPQSDFSAIPIPGIGSMMRTVTSLLDDDPIEVLTAEDGTFRITAVTPGSYDLRVQQRGYIPLERPVTATSDSVQDVGTLKLDPGESLYGRVVDAGGQPVVGALVSAFATQNRMMMGGMSDDEINGRLRTKTDDKGRFTISGLGTKKYGLAATAHGFGSAVEKEVVPGTGTTLTLTPGWTVHGVVVSGVDGSPVEGVQVQTGASLASTNADGMFTLEEVSPGELAPGGMGMGRSRNNNNYVRISAKHDDYVTKRQRVNKEDIDNGVVRIEVWPQCVIRGSVVGPDNQPLPGVLIQVVPPGEAPEALADMIFVAATVTDLEGNFEVKGGPLDLDGTVRIKASHVKYATEFSEDIETEEGVDPPPVSLRLVNGGILEGQVTDGQYPLAGVQVRVGRASDQDAQQGMMMAMFGIPAGGRRVYTDEEGYYRVERVAPGAYEVEAKGVHFSDSSKEKTSIGSGDTVVVNFTLDPGGVIEGSVVDKSGAPLAGARVRVIDQKAEGDEERMFRRMMKSSLQTVVTDDFGLFRAVGIPREPMTVTAELDGYVPTEMTDVAPDSGSLRLVLRIEARVEGVVTDAGTGKPLHEFQVRLERKDGVERTESMPFSMFDRWRSFEDSAGRFSFQDLEPGRYAMDVKARGYALFNRELTLREGEIKRVDASLGESGILTGVVVDDKTGKPVRGASVNFATAADSDDTDALTRMMMGGQSRTDKDGQFEITEIPDGKQVLEVRHQNYVLERKELNISPAESAEVKIRLREGLTLAGTAYFRSGGLAQGSYLLLDGNGESKFGFIRDDGGFRFSGLAPGQYTIRQMNGFGGGGRGGGPSSTVVTEISLDESVDDLVVEIDEVEGRGGGG